MSREEVRKSLDYAFEGIRALIRNDPLPPPRPGTYRVRIRVPEDYKDGQPERWTALADVFAGQGYDYHTVGFAVEIEFGPALSSSWAGRLTRRLRHWFWGEAFARSKRLGRRATRWLYLRFLASRPLSISRDPEPSGRDPLT